MLLRATFGGGETRFFVIAGPQLSFKLSCKSKSTGVAEKDCQDASAPKSGPKSTDFGVVFGAGVSFGRLSASIRYDLGLANLSQFTDTGDPTIKNKAILLLIGFSFGK